MKGPIILLIAIILFGAIGIAIGYLSEKKSFNNGKCSECNTPLRLFDCDSQGGRGYVCDKCRRHVWISYNSVDRTIRFSMFEPTIQSEDKKDE